MGFSFEDLIWRPIYRILFNESQKSPTVNAPVADINTMNIISYIFIYLEFVECRHKANYNNRNIAKYMPELCSVSTGKIRIY